MRKNLANKKIIISGIFVLSLFWNQLYAAVMYVNPNPDITYNTNGMQTTIDLNNDGQPGIRLRLDFQDPMSYFYHLGGSFVNGSGGMMDATLGLNASGGFPYWKILSPGTMIGPTSPNFQSTMSDGPVLGDIENINIINKGDCFIGLLIKINGNSHYAWMRVNLTGNTNNLVPNIVKDWAYESTPNTAIAAGDMGNGVNNVAVTGITVTGQGGASTITTGGGSLQMNAAVMPANATNTNVTWSVQNGTGSATISTTGLLTAQTNGTVTVKATAQDGSNVSGNRTITISGQTVGIKDVNLLTSSFYPNPVKDAITLQFENAETIRNIRIVNIAGQVVYEDRQVRKGTSVNVPVVALSEGTYILTFENVNGKQGLQKFVKQ